MEHSIGLDDDTRLVKMADKMYNLQDMLTNPPPEWTPAYIVGSSTWILRIAANLVAHCKDTHIKEILEKMQQELESDALQISAKYFEYVCSIVPTDDKSFEDVILEQYYSLCT